MKEIFANRQESDVIEIDASFSRSQYTQIQNGEVEVEIPSDTEMTNKAGSRSIYFTCYGKKAAMELVDGLDASSVPWQEVCAGEDVFTDNTSEEKNE